MQIFATQFRRDDADEAARMVSLHDRIKQSGEDTTSAIEAGNREAAKSSLLLIATIAGLASAMKNQWTCNAVFMLAYQSVLKTFMYWSYEVHLLGVNCFSGVLHFHASYA
jgi:hypothetical protein